MASDAYWNATKPNGMPDHVWKEMQEKKKAEEKEKKKAEEADKKKAEEIKKAAEESAKKAVEESVNNLLNGTYIPSGTVTVPQEMVNGYNKYQTEKEIEDTIKYLESQKTSSTAEHNGTSTNDARAEQVAVKNDTTPNYSKDYTGNSNNTNKSSKPDNTGLTTEDARKEHTNVMNNPAINPPTDGQISAGATTPVTNSGAGSNPAPSTGSSNSSSSPSSPSSSSSSPSNSAPSSTPIANTVKIPTTEEMANYVATIIQAARGELGEVVAPEYMQATAPISPELRTLEDLAKTYGITYDYDSIYKILNDSVEKQYEAVYERQKQNEAAYYDNATAAQNTLLDTLSRDRSSAVQAGVSKGMQAANALGAMLGVSQQFANNATALSQERGNTAKDYGAALAKAVVDAETTSNERKNAIMEISKMLYGYDSEQYVANMDNYNTILTNNAALQQSYMNNHTALQNALASIFGGVANNKITGDANVQSSLLASEAQKAAQWYAATAQQYAAQQSLLGSQYAADINKEIAMLQYGALNNTLAGNEAALAGTESSTGANNGNTNTSTKPNTSGSNVASNWLDLLSKAAYNTMSGSTNNMYYK